MSNAIYNSESNYQPISEPHDNIEDDTAELILTQSQNQSLRDNLDKTSDALASANEKTITLTSKNNELQEKIDELEKENASLQQDLQDSMSMLETATKECDQYQAEIKELQSQIQEKNQESAAVQEILHYFDVKDLNGIIVLFEKIQKATSQSQDIQERYDLLEYELQEALATSQSFEKAKNDLLAQNIALQKEIERLQLIQKSEISPLSASSTISFIQKSGFSTPSPRHITTQNEEEESILAENERLRLDNEDLQNTIDAKQMEIDELVEKTRLQQQKIDELNQQFMKQKLAISSPMKINQSRTDEASENKNISQTYFQNSFVSDQENIKSKCVKLQGLIKNIHNFEISANKKLNFLEKKYSSMNDILFAAARLVHNEAPKKGQPKGMNEKLIKFQKNHQFELLSNQIENLADFWETRRKQEDEMNEYIISQITKMGEEQKYYHHEIINILSK